MMKKRLLSLLLCLCMLLSLAPLTASAVNIVPPTFTATYSGQTYGPITLSSGDYLLQNCTINGGDNTPGITLAPGSFVKLYVAGKS